MALISVLSSRAQLGFHVLFWLEGGFPLAFPIMINSHLTGQRVSLRFLPSAKYTKFNYALRAKEMTGGGGGGSVDTLDPPVRQIGTGIH